MQIVVHGCGVTALGNNDGLSRYENAMGEAFEIKHKGRLGHDINDLKEMRLLNRILRIDDHGLLYEADPRHVELLARELDLDHATPYVAPGVKQSISEEAPPDETLEDSVASIIALPKPPPAVKRKGRLQKVSFSEDVDATNIIPYAETDGQHPNNFIIASPIGKLGFAPISKNVHPFAGLPFHVHEQRRRELKPGPNERRSKLHRFITEGADWERKTSRVKSSNAKEK